MLEIFFLIVSTGGIAGYARARGGNPYLWGTLSVAGHLVIQLGGGVVLGLLGLAHDENAMMVVMISSYAWIGVVALCTRFILGRGQEKPSGMWTCPNCKYLNQHYAVVCEACKQPYAKLARST